MQPCPNPNCQETPHVARHKCVCGFDIKRHNEKIKLSKRPKRKRKLDASNASQSFDIIMGQVCQLHCHPLRRCQLLLVFGKGVSNP